MTSGESIEIQELSLDLYIATSFLKLSHHYLSCPLRAHQEAIKAEVEALSKHRQNFQRKCFYEIHTIHISP